LVCYILIVLTANCIHLSSCLQARGNHFFFQQGAQGQKSSVVTKRDTLIFTPSLEIVPIVNAM